MLDGRCCGWSISTLRSMASSLTLPSVPAYRKYDRSRRPNAAKPLVRNSLWCNYGFGSWLYDRPLTLDRLAKMHFSGHPEEAGPGQIVPIDPVTFWIFQYPMPCPRPSSSLRHGHFEEARMGASHPWCIARTGCAAWRMLERSIRPVGNEGWSFLGMPPRTNVLL